MTPKKKLDLGGGYVAQLEDSDPSDDIWRVYDTATMQKVGQCYITKKRYDSGPSIESINLFGARGQGLGRKLVPQLVAMYGSLSSDPLGRTEPAAESMWKALKASKVMSAKSKKGYFYLLTKQ